MNCIRVQLDRLNKSCEVQGVIFPNRCMTTLKEKLLALLGRMTAVSRPHRLPMRELGERCRSFQQVSNVAARQPVSARMREGKNSVKQIVAADPEAHANIRLRTY